MKIKDKVLIVEDEQSISSFISMILTANGYDTIIVNTGEEALTMISSHCPDLIVLDLGLPDMDGLEVLRSVRKWSSLPIGVVSARNHERDKVEALDYGADDYLVKPFENKELIARVNALGRRKGRPFVDDIYTKSGVEMNSRTGMLTAGGKELKLSRREFELFRLLFVNSGQIILRETILDKVWTDNPEISPASLDAYIYILRRKIREFSGRIRIRLVKGIGYVLEIEE